MPNEIQHKHLLSADWPTATIIALAILAVIVWVGSHWLSRQTKNFKLVNVPLFLIRCLIGAVALWLVCNGLNRTIVLATSWYIPGICLFCAVVIELILAFYHFEREFVSLRLGSLLAGLRTAVVLALGLMLLQPVFAWSYQRVHERFIAVLIDDSQSMQITDQQLTDTEKLQLIRVFDPTIAKPPYNLNNSVAELTPLPERLSAAAQALVEISAETDDKTLQNEFSVRRKSLEQVITEVQNVAGDQSKRLRDLLQTEVQLKQEITEAAQLQQRRLDSEVVARLVEAEQLIDKHAQNIKPELRSLIDHFNGSAGVLRQVIAGLPRIVDDADRSYFASLPPEKRTKAEQVLGQTRAEIARTLLIGDNDQIQGLIDKIKAGYEIRVFRFNKNCSELDMQRWLEGEQQSEVGLTDVSLTTNAQTDSDAVSSQADDASNEEASATGLTDIAAALQQVQNEIPRENLAGVLLVTDGRHNASGDVEATARKLLAENVPVNALVIGSSRPPVDAAILDVEYPSTVLVDDLLALKAHVRLTGMKGRSVKADLFEKDQSVGEKLINIDSDDFTTTIELSHVPTQEGFGKYRLQIEPVDADASENEAFSQNNSKQFTVAVSDNRTEILIIEGRSRWEFGYLRNLFASRDVSVQLQSVLLEPEKLAGDNQRPAVHASASREADQTEATLLPANEAEWLKFDVIFLGDVSLEMLPPTQQENLHKFVSKRGGTLIVIAGQKYMPHRFANTQLAEMLPIEFEPRNEVLFKSPELEFDFRLTNVGQRHPIMRQADSAEESEKIWLSMPKLYWRHASTGVKPGAAVLAYAAIEQTEQQLKPVPDETPEAAEQRRAKREAYEKLNALVSIQQFGNGRVMMMNTDRTWRFRYREGDTYHHRYWGQVLRWATSEKLQAGTNFVQVGAERLTYMPDESVVVSAKLTDSYFAPIEDPEAKIKVYRGSDLVISKNLEAIADTPGSYRVDLGKMPGHGTFRIELDSPESKKVFAGSQDGPIATEITVNKPENRSAEMLEPTADRAGLARLTAAGGGTVVEADSKNKVLDYFAEGTQRYIEPHSIRLWDTWPLLALMVILVTAEWIVRKKGGLV